MKEKDGLTMFRGGLHAAGIELIPASFIPNDTTEISASWRDHDHRYHDTWIRLRQDNFDDLLALLKYTYRLNDEELAAVEGLDVVHDFHLPTPPFAIHESEMDITSERKSKKEYAAEVINVGKVFRTVNEFFRVTDYDPDGPFGLAIRAHYVTQGLDDVDPAIYTNGQIKSM